MTKLTIPRDPTGEIIYPGSIKKQVEANFMFSTSLPSWLANDSPGGTVAVTTMASPSFGNVTLQSNNGGQARLELANSMSMQYWGALRWDLEGVTFDGASAQIAGLWLGFSNNSNVGTFVKLGDTSTINAYEPASTPHSVDHKFTNRGSKRSNVSFLAFPRYKQAYILENDQVVAHVDAPNMVNSGLITPSVTYKSVVGYTNKVTISQIRFTAWGNG